jgi:hypothetical protein
MRNAQFETVIYNTLDELATDAIVWQHTAEQIDRDIDVAFFTLEHCFPQYSLGDTVTRGLAKNLVFELQLKFKGERKNFSAVCEYVEQQLNIEELLRDVYQVLS